MADQRIQYTEQMVGASHPTLGDTLNRLSLVEHNNDGTHKGAGAAWTLIQAQTASASATIDFTTGIDGTYDAYMIVLSGVVPATDGASLHLRVAVAGPTWKAGGSDYESAFRTLTSGAVANTLTSTANDNIEFTDTVSNVAGEGGVNGEVRFRRPAAAEHHQFKIETTCKKHTPADLSSSVGGGSYIGTQEAIVGVRFLFSAGNIASGSFALYGQRKA